MYTIKFWYIDKDHEITVRELKIVITHVYAKILLYWQRAWNNNSRAKIVLTHVYTNILLYRQRAWINVVELKILLTHIYTKILLYWQRAWNIDKGPEITIVELNVVLTHCRSISIAIIKYKRLCLYV